VEYPDVTRFLTAYWPTHETDDATALHAMLCAARSFASAMVIVAPSVIAMRGDARAR